MEQVPRIMQRSMLRTPCLSHVETAYPQGKRNWHGHIKEKYCKQSADGKLICSKNNSAQAVKEPMMVGRIPNRSARIPPPAFPNTIASVRNSASQFFAHGKCMTLPAKERSTTTKIQQNAMRSDQLPCIGFMENSCFGKFRSSEFRQKIS